MKSARPLDRFPVIRTQNAEEMCTALAGIYAKPTVVLERRTKNVDLTLNYYPMKDIGLGFARYGIGISLAYPDTNVTLQTFPLRGQGEARVDEFAGPLDTRHGLTLSPGMSAAVKVSTSYEHLFLVINTQALANKVAAITGTSIRDPMKFHPIRDDTRPAAKAVRDHFSFLVDKVSTCAVPLPNVVLEEFEQTLMVMLLHANQHNYSHLLPRASPDLAPWQVRRAEEYIEANWQRAITLEDMVEVTGVSAFSLFRAFKTSRGFSPMEFANRTRLRHARELLQRPDTTTTVAEVASTCGFADLGRLDNDYVRAFGELPSETLGHGKMLVPPGI